MGSSRHKKVKIIGVPVDLGSRPLGVEMGPSAIRYAGLAEALELNGIAYEDHGDLRVERTKVRDKVVAGIARLSEELAVFVDQSISEGCLPIILGGDHSASIGSVAGAAKGRKLGLLWLDCHPDANTPETSPSGNVHGMPVAIALGHGYPELVRCAQFSPKVLPQHVCIIGAKDIDQGERELLSRIGVRMFTLSDVEQLGIVKVFTEAMKIVTEGTEALHVSFDVDVLDPVIAPGTGIVSRGGLSYREIFYLMEGLAGSGRMSSLDIIEINPLLDVRNQTAELAVELVLQALGGSYGDYERSYLQRSSVRS